MSFSVLSARRGYQNFNKKLCDVEDNQEAVNRPERKQTWVMLSTRTEKKKLLMMTVVLLGLSLLIVWYILPLNTSSIEVASHKLPEPYTKRHDDTRKVITRRIRIHGVDITFGTRKLSDEEFILGHVSREINGYALMKDAILLARSTKKERPLVLDVGSNHGLYSIFAAKLGADVITVEPQESLCKLINEVAVLNQVETQITVYHNAVLDQNEIVTLANANINEGGIATLVRGDSRIVRGAPASTMETFPICDFVHNDDRRRIAFLKIDVEGFELHAIPSAGKLLERVDNILVEFGPPSRWISAASDNSTTGLTLLQDMQTEYGMTPRLIDSLVWPTHFGELDEKQASLAVKQKSISLASKSSRQTLIDSMIQSRSEGYVWFIRDAESHFTTFERDCGGDHSFKEGANNLTLFGCNVDE